MSVLLGKRSFFFIMYCLGHEAVVVWTILCFEGVVVQILCVCVCVLNRMDCGNYIYKALYDGSGKELHNNCQAYCGFLALKQAVQMNVCAISFVVEFICSVHNGCCQSSHKYWSGVVQYYKRLYLEAFNWTSQ